METARIIEAIQSDVAALTALGDEGAAEVGGRIAAAMAAPLRLRLIEAVTEAAGELDPQLPEGRVDVRLMGGDPVLVYVEDAPASGSARAGRAPVEEEPSEARITLRLPESLKAAVDAAAARGGLSVNTWLVQVIARSLEVHTRRAGTRLTGFARS